MSDAGAALAALHATWPAAEVRALGPWTLRRGAAGGNRVSAATAAGPVTAADIDDAEAGMRAFGQSPLFMIREGDESLDAALAARGYGRRDDTVLMTGPVSAAAFDPPPRLTAIPAWPPVALQAEIWATGGVGAARLAVMARAPDPKTTFLGRHRDRTAGTVFAACHDDTVMAHALYVSPGYRGEGVARRMMAAVGLWGAAHRAQRLAVAVTAANRGARRLYASLGLGDVGQYHYRALAADGTG